MTRKRSIIVQLIWLFPLVIATPLGLDLCLPGMPMISRELGSLQGMTQWLISGFVLCLSLSQLLFGPMVDQLGSQRVFLYGGVFYTLGSLGVYFADSFSLMVVLRLMQGCSAGAMGVSVLASIPLRFQGAAIGKAFSILNGVISLVPVLAPIIGGVLVVSYGWRSSFYVLGIFTLLCCLLALWKPLPKKCQDTEFQLVTIFSGYLKVLRHPEFLLGCFASSFGFASQLIFFSSSPIVLIEVLHIPVDRFGYYFSVNAVAITAGSLLTARLLGVVKVTKMLSGGALLLLLAMFGFVLTVYLFRISVWPYLISATFGSLGFAILIGTGAAIALSPFTHLAGRASAMMAAIQMSFSSLIAWLVITYWSSSWWSMMIAYFLLAIAIWILLFVYKVNTPIMDTN
ncbi:multidrug effflux MFS transporter [Xenorhabdus doucetiae]|uniref:DHA1 family bicyclomycin/chloramphenicol resistance-like MFS transporter n=1 Tax=Xenorhabdus doucetiae TaxID=351671 RepID=A0A068QVJ5_9GAMM|nr:multidrug effflux MFS transporter [Xenorhabdus doucetiae]TYP13134.1 DHA1 family bicyclomycin/chloramphenicol resistance-like MFS transporter [Xenorhabdus doucetiae]CDG18666.1 Drug resistance transporter, Bcr/CflA subfamily [Xenorhabdus doucetiae]